MHEPALQTVQQRLATHRGAETGGQAGRSQRPEESSGPQLRPSTWPHHHSLGVGLLPKLHCRLAAAQALELVQCYHLVVMGRHPGDPSAGLRPGGTSDSCYTAEVRVGAALPASDAQRQNAHTAYSQTNTVSGSRSHVQVRGRDRKRCPYECSHTWGMEPDDTPPCSTHGSRAPRN